VHGKKHHRAGTFGGHVRGLELLRSNGERLSCSAVENPEWFAATVGGLGLTGVVTRAQLQLRRVPGSRVNLETLRFANLDEFFGLCEGSDRNFEYTVAWIDCLGRGKHLGRGILQRANHAPDESPQQPVASGKMVVPFAPPLSLVNGVSLRLFNTLHYYWQGAGLTRSSGNFQSFLFPLDRILHWNRLYGPRGFYQYQCVIPAPASREAAAQLLTAIARSGLGSFLAVLKRFGSSSSPGMLSFPREGVTLALDFPNKGPAVERLFVALDSIVSASGGRLYPAKDGRMPGALFRSGYPRWRELAQYIDPRCSSSFWRRVTENT
jgi:FAD/FMN-containing dehydrogenase